MQRISKSASESPTASAPSLANHPPRRSVSWLGLAGCVFVLLAGCQKQPLSVGAVLPLTGDDAAYGQSTRRGMELAQAELKKQGRAMNFVFDFADSESSAEVALARYEELLANRTLLTVGGITPDEARALAPLAEQRERVVLSPTAHDQQLGASNRFFYRLAPSAAVTGTTIATFAAQDLNLKSMVLIAETKIQGDLLEEGLGSTFDRYGGEMLGRFDLDEAELRWALEEIGRLRPAAVTLAGWGDWLAETVKSLKAEGYRGKIFVPESFAAPSVRAAAGSAARGVLVAGSPFEVDANDAIQAFADAYRARFSEEPDLYAAAGWDTVLVLEAALADHPNLPGEVRQWLRDDVKDIAGVIGHLQFNETGAATKYPRVYSVQKDLALKDHGRWLEEEKQRLAERKRHLEDERLKILQQMSKPGSADPTGDETDDGIESVSQIASSG